VETHFVTEKARKAGEPKKSFVKELKEGFLRILLGGVIKRLGSEEGRHSLDWGMFRNVSKIQIFFFKMSISETSSGEEGELATGARNLRVFFAWGGSLYL